MKFNEHIIQHIVINVSFEYNNFVEKYRTHFFHRQKNHIKTFLYIKKNVAKH